MPRGAGNANRDVPLVLTEGWSSYWLTMRGPWVPALDGDQRISRRKPIRVDWKSDGEDHAPVLYGVSVQPAGRGNDNCVLLRGDGVGSLYTNLPFLYSASASYIVRIGGENGFLMPLDAYPNGFMNYSDTKTGNGVLKAFTLSAPWISWFFITYAVTVDGVAKTEGVDYTLSSLLGEDNLNPANYLRIIFDDAPADEAVIVIESFAQIEQTDKAAYSVYDGGSNAYLQFAKSSVAWDSEHTKFIGITRELLDYGSFKVIVNGSEVTEDPAHYDFTWETFGSGSYAPELMFLNLYGTTRSNAAGHTVSVEFIPRQGVDIEVYKVPLAEWISLGAGTATASEMGHSVWITKSADFIFALKSGGLAAAEVKHSLTISNINRTA